MSGAPNRPEVRELAEALRRARSVSSQIRQHESIIVDAQAALKPLREERGTLGKRIQELLLHMDVEAPGNYGHESRVASLAFLIYEAGEEYARDHPPLPVEDARRE